MSQQEIRRAAHADTAQLIERAWRLRHDDSRQARGAALRALDLATTRGDPLGAAWATLRLAVCEHILAIEQDDELARLQTCVDAMRLLGDSHGEAEALNLLGNTLSIRGDHEASLQAHRQCCALRETAGDAAGVAGSLGNQAIPLRALGRWHEARRDLATGEPDGSLAPVPVRQTRGRRCGQGVIVPCVTEKGRAVARPSAARPLLAHLVELALHGRDLFLQIVERVILGGLFLGRLFRGFG